MPTLSQLPVSFPKVSGKYNKLMHHALLQHPLGSPLIMEQLVDRCCCMCTGLQVTHAVSISQSHGLCRVLQMSESNPGTAHMWPLACGPHCCDNMRPLQYNTQYSKQAILMHCRPEFTTAGLTRAGWRHYFQQWELQQRELGWQPRQQQWCQLQ